MLSPAFDTSGDCRRLVNLEQGAAFAVQRKTSERELLRCVRYSNEIACVRAVVTDALSYCERFGRLADRYVAIAGGTGARTR